jgi:hypothetical protein
MVSVEGREYTVISVLAAQNGDIGVDIINIIYLGSFLFFMVYGQKFQTWMMLREIGNAVYKLKEMRDKARGVAITSVKENGQEELDPSARIDHFLEYFTIMPASLDPAGIVPKFEHLLDTRDQRFKDEVKLIAPEADNVQANNIEGVLEVAIGLNMIYRVVNHFYLMGKKTMNLYVIMQIQMQLPLIMQMAEAYSAAITAFAEGQPIGDGAGALVAAKLMHGHASRTIEKETVVAETEFDGRRLLVLKAQGPGSTVGKPGKGIRKLLEEEDGKIAMVIMIDAAGKYEGEDSGGVSEGVGAAIGGIGIDQFTIEEVTLKYQIPIHAVIVKESIQESVAPMIKEILEGTDVALARVKRIIREGSSEGDTIVVAGIGNTVGVGQ